jgi:pimeloyl-ACP methyl ester carboxylesterase
MSSTRVAGPAGALAVDDGGRGEPVVLLHSLAGNTAHWSAQLEHLRKSRRAVALDFRGHGQSEVARNGDYAIESLSGDVAAVVDRLGLDRFALIGHSLGGGVALVYAGANPARVTHLLVVDPIGDSTQYSRPEVESFLAALESAASQEFIEGYWTSAAGDDAAVREVLLRDLRATAREAVVQGLHGMMRFDPRAALARYRGQLLAVVTPANDEAYSMHRVGAGFPHHVITGTGHWLQIERPAEFNRLMDGFLKG